MIVVDYPRYTTQTHHDHGKHGRGSHPSGPEVRLARSVGAELRPIAAVAQAHRAVWARAVGGVPDDDAALVVAHGGAIEPTLVACLPETGHGSWGAPLAHCDGARLGFAGGRFISIQFRRAPVPVAS
jgi:broad specificity phosphatase PhoE